jgi:hypothetical protein
MKEFWLEIYKKKRGAVWTNCYIPTYQISRFFFPRGRIPTPPLRALLGHLKKKNNNVNLTIQGRRQLNERGKLHL